MMQTLSDSCSLSWSYSTNHHAIALSKSNKNTENVSLITTLSPSTKPTNILVYFQDKPWLKKKNGEKKPVGSRLKTLLIPIQQQLKQLTMLLGHNLQNQPTDIKQHGQNHDKPRHKQCGETKHQTGLQIFDKNRNKQA